MTRSTMTRRHFVLIAEALKIAKASDEVIREMADKLATTNSNFKRQRFCDACKSGQPEKPVFELKRFADAVNTGHEKYLAIYAGKVTKL
jgi:hypothetical protein